ncbi:C1 family peptidase [Furfurilactobacillus milii]|uniref:Aminopeptidase n=1 Tax=Furfurilactobacillus milii TaxID=2888272 RepID=A0ABT6DAQ7_9LACO|nr:C1 family peptidase [Furfurilactobacillus milii]QLE67596.1 Aminopeptidase C [Furfurilactobacillus rossiae]MCF6161348.1 C1 family peptidase [Furfurilactobacillus milii]MCF6163728.1 C1 family peptidase [Furfurilactobacillus milii]MDF9914224.1 C1 family peptidase [Furfurilactobacillus milii]QLE70024.1 Aminopeptidase C [Furfurilactobacillus rossiae]
MSEAELTRPVLDAATIADLQADYAKQPQAAILERAVTKNGVKAASWDNHAATRLNRAFSIEVDTGAVSNQKHSGRCWLFATLNTLRHSMAKQYKVKDFELSQSYLFFWDRVERANTFYTKMIEDATRPIDDREVQKLMSMAGTDGGQWNMAAGLVQKYGVVPSYVMPEVHNTEDSSEIELALNTKERKDAVTLRTLVSNGASEEQLEAVRRQMLREVYRMAAYAFGEPPVKFDFEYTGDDKKYHIDRDLTPKDFLNKYFTADFNDYVVVTNSPDKAYNKLYAMPAQDNIQSGNPIHFLNVPMDELNRVATAQLKDGETVWFGNDVLQQMDRKTGYLDSKLFQTDALFNVDSQMSKADRLLTGQGEVSHAMTLTGVDVVDDQPRRWKVENSWGKENGADGYFVMSADWFNDYVYEVVVNKKYLTPDQQALLTSTPTILPSWDPLA